jgi:hypothetical protein
VILDALPLNFDGRIVLVEPKTDPSEFPRLIPPGGPLPYGRRHHRE